MAGRCAAALLVAMLATVNFAVGINNPSRPVWDESYYLTSTQRYEDGVAQFASHPPLGLMLIAAGDGLLHVNRGLDTKALGRDKKVSGNALPPGFSFAGVRAMSAVFAVGGATLFFALLEMLTQSVLAAALLANLYVFDNAFIAQFRAAQLDAFQIFFAICALLCFVAGFRSASRDPYGPRSYASSFLFGLSCGLAAMVRLNALALGLLGIQLVFERARQSWSREALGNPGSRRNLAAWIILDTGSMVMGGLVATITVFSLSVAVARHPPDPTTPAGMKDRDFVSTPYRDYLEGARRFSPSVVLAEVRDYARFMAADFAGMARTDSNASTALQWPLNHKTINFRWDTRGAQTRYVQLSGNSFGWLLALAAPLAALSLIVLQKLRPHASVEPQRHALMAALLVQYVAVMCLHMLLGTQRVMYIYHYFIGLLLAFCLIPLVWMEAAERWPPVRTRTAPVLAGTTALLLANFLFYAPLTFHQPLTHSQCEWRNLFQAVVECRP